MTNPRKPQTWTFPCYQWLSLYESDCQVRRSLKPLVHKKAEKVGTSCINYIHMYICTCYIHTLLVHKNLVAKVSFVVLQTTETDSSTVSYRHVEIMITFFCLCNLVVFYMYM